MGEESKPKKNFDSGEAAFIGVITAFYFTQLPAIIDSIRSYFSNLTMLSFAFPLIFSYIIGTCWLVCVVLALYASKTSNLSSQRKDWLQKAYTWTFNANIKYITPISFGFLGLAYAFNAMLSFVSLNPLAATILMILMAIAIIISIAVRYVKKVIE